MAILLTLCACSTSSGGDVRAGHPGSGDTLVAANGGNDSSPHQTASGSGTGFSEGGADGGESLLGGPGIPYDEQATESVVPFFDPRTGQTYEIVDGCVLIGFKNPPVLPAIDPNYLDVEPALNDPYLTSQTYGFPSEDPVIAAFIAAEQLTVFSEWPVSRGIAANLPPGQTVLDAVVNWPLEYPDLILTVDPDALLYTQAFPQDKPNDDHYTAGNPDLCQWAVDDDTNDTPQDEATEYDINIRRAWRMDQPKSFGANTTVVAILDTGVQWGHADLQQNSKYYGANVGSSIDSTTITPRSQGGGEPWDWVQEGVPMACGHGTMVAGIVSAHINNDTGSDPDGEKDIAGIARYCHYVPIALKYKGYFRTSTVNNGLLVMGCIKRIFSPSANLRYVPYVPYYNIEVANLSLGGRKYDAQQEFLIGLMWPSILCVVAAGNEQPWDQPNYPAALNRCLSVRGHTRTGQMWYNYHASVDMAAPAINVYSTDMKGQNSSNQDLGYWPSAYAAASGTSFAAPQVAGVAALVAAANSTYSADAIKSRLEATAVPLGGGHTFDRRVDAYNALFGP